MVPSSFEYRFRSLWQGSILAIGFWPTFAPLVGLPTGLGWFGMAAKSTWLVLSADMARQGWLGFQGATSLLLTLAIALTALGAWFRVWGSAYPGVGASTTPGAVGSPLHADGPYRRSRNPLFLGTILHVAGVALLMAPAMAIFAVAASWILQIRLAMVEEQFFTQRFGESFQEYMRKVPRFLPSPTPQVPAGPERPRWIQAVLGQSYLIGVVITLAAAGWDFNALPLLKGILISLGVSLVLQAVMPRPNLPSPVTAVA